MKKPGSNSKVTQEEVIKDFIEVNERFLDANPDKEVCNQPFYDAHGNYSSRVYTRLFAGFTGLKEKALKQGTKLDVTDRRVIRLRNEVKDLKKRNEDLSSKSIKEEDILEVYKQNIEKIDWFELSMNPNALHLLEQFPEKIDW